MLVHTRDTNENVAMEACEFWLTLAEQTEICKESLGPFLPRLIFFISFFGRYFKLPLFSFFSLIPILLDGMKYSKDDIALLKADIEDENVPDKDSEIRPWFPKGKSHMVGGNVQVEEESDDEDELREEVLSDWNLRK